jgi:hypothetical protein
LGPDGAIGPEVDLFEGAYDSLLYPLLGHALAVHGAALVAHLGDEVLGLGGGVKLADFIYGVAEGLLDGDVLAVVDGPHGCWVVGVVWGGDDDAVYLSVHLVEHLAIVVVELGDVGGDGVGGVVVVLLPLLGGFFQPVLCDVYEGYDVVAECDVAGVC